MKKHILIGIIFVLIMASIKALGVQKIIPDEAIRLRVIANSNSKRDQEIKIKVKNHLQGSMFELLKETKGIDEARRIINNNLGVIDNQIDKLLKKENYNWGYTLNFGYNYFPAKKYKGITYDEGYYESVLVTLGEGKGENWWCILFPPLCLLEAKEADAIEYKFFIKELIEKYL